MRELLQLIQYILIGVALYCGMVQDYKPALNIFMFYSWIQFVYGLALIFNKESRSRHGGSALPHWVVSVFHTAVTCMLAGFGMFWYAFMWVIVGGSEYGTVTGAFDNETKQEAKA